MLIFCVNDCKFINAIEITLRYFEPVHFFMAANSTQVIIENVLGLTQGQIYEFSDICDRFEAACLLGASYANVGGFRNWGSGISHYTLKKADDYPFLAKITLALFRRGDYNFFVSKQSLASSVY